MLNKIWCFFIVIAIVFSLINGTYTQVNNSIFIGIEDTVTLIISFVGSISFWNGIMNIIQNTSLIDKLKKILSPLIKLIFPKIDLESEAGKNIAMNMTTNILGLGNAATPCGLKAIEELQKDNLNEKTLEEHYDFYEKLGLEKKEIIKKIAKDRNVAKNEIYQYFM